MGKRFICVSLAALLLVTAFSYRAEASSGGVGRTAYENTLKLADGFTLTNTVSTGEDDARVESFLLETRPGSPVYPIVVTSGSIYEPMTIDGITQWASDQGLNVYAAINADFFYGTLKLPQGCVIENGRYLSDINGDNVLAFGAFGAYACKKPEIRMTLTNAAGGTVQISHLNKVRNSDGGIYLYDSAYHPDATQTYLDGWAVRFQILEGQLTASGRMRLKVAEVVPEGMDYEIGEGYLVITAPSDSRYSDEYKKFSVGDIVTLETECSDPYLREAVWATGCGDLLAEYGRVTDETTWDKAIEENHPRTAVGIKPDGSVIACVIDGRTGNYSDGATLKELANELLSRGCNTVVNLDGGGSSAMSVRMPGNEKCAVINHPSGGDLRECSTYILFVSDVVPNGHPGLLGFSNDGAFVLTGSSLPLDLVAVDAAGMPAKVPDDVYVYAYGGTVTEREIDGLKKQVYTAGSTPARENLELYSSSTGASGYGTVHVVDTVDYLTVLDAETGKAPVLNSLLPGAVIRLSVSATKLARPVTVNGPSVDFSVSENIGEITPDGVLTVTGEPGAEGELSVMAGGVTAVFPMKIKGGYTDVEGHWAERYIDELYERGVLIDTPDMTFGPNGTIERCDLIVMLWRAASSPVAEGQCAFRDVYEEDYYYDAVNWAQSVGLTYGTDIDIFSPHGFINREQAFTLIYRYLSIFGVELPEPDRAALERFGDATDISAFAVDAIASLTAKGIVSGTGSGLLPLRATSRGEAATVIYFALFASEKK